MNSNKEKEYNKTLCSIKGIEERGIRSWSTAIGYKLLMGKLNRLSKELGIQPYKNKFYTNHKPNE